VVNSAVLGPSFIQLNDGWDGKTGFTMGTTGLKKLPWRLYRGFPTGKTPGDLRPVINFSKAHEKGVGPSFKKGKTPPKKKTPPGGGLEHPRGGGVFSTQFSKNLFLNPRANFETLGGLETEKKCVSKKFFGEIFPDVCGGEIIFSKKGGAPPNYLVCIKHIDKNVLLRRRCCPPEIVL